MKCQIETKRIVEMLAAAEKSAIAFIGLVVTPSGGVIMETRTVDCSAAVYLGKSDGEFEAGAVWFSGHGLAKRLITIKRVEIFSDGANCRIYAMPSSVEIAEICAVSDGDIFDIPEMIGKETGVGTADSIAAAIEDVVDCASSSDARKVLCGVAFDSDGECRTTQMGRILASNGCALKIADNVFSSSGFSGDVTILPSDLALCFAKLCRQFAGDVNMLFGKDGEGRPLFLAEGNGFRFLARCVDAQYPNYRQVCAPAPIQIGEVDCVKFRSAVKIFQAGIPRKEFPSQHLFLVFDADGSMYLCKSEGKKGILVGGSFTAETLRVRINPALFARVLPRAGRVLANARNKDSFMRDPLTFSYGQTTALVMPMCDSA